MCLTHALNNSSSWYICGSVLNVLTVNVAKNRIAIQFLWKKMIVL